MRAPMLVALLGLVLSSPEGVAQQPRSGRTLPAFGSERALMRFLDASWKQHARQVVRTQSCPGASSHRPTVQFSSGRPDRFLVRGRVLDASGKPLSGASVRLAGRSFGAITGTSGQYIIDVRRDSTGPGKVQIAATVLGYCTSQRALTLPAGKSATVEFRLAAASVSLAEIVVSGYGTPAPAAKAADAAEGITNVQQAGVDEGGIVKLHGDHLVVLRRGRLFTVAVGAGRLAPVSAVNAYGGDIDGRGTWYDELLVSRDRVVVIGYSYARGGTEIGLFDIDDAGRLHYRRTFHLRSGDYYSSRNYASRLVGSRLVLYSPVPVPYSRAELGGWLPAMRWWSKDTTGQFHPITDPARIYRPGRDVAPSTYLVLHTVTTCDLAPSEPVCQATAVLGPYGRVFYVSPGSVYLWTSDWRPRGRPASPSMLYRIPLDGSPPSALGVSGSPVDQFSFLENDGNQLNVLVRDEARGEGMWSAERARGRVALLRIPLTAIADGRTDAPASAYTALPEPGRSYFFHNRFVGDWLLYGTGSGWWNTADTSHAPTLYAVRWNVKEGQAVAAPTEIGLPHGIDRIEPMGSDAVVVGTNDKALHFSGIRLSGTPRRVQHYALPGAQQGELRSHGFFYRPDRPGVGGRSDSGTLGLPVRGGEAQGWEHLFRGSAAVVFLRNDGRQFTVLGSLASQVEKPADDGCVASCVDWYGNARPIFLGDRILALLGYELVEGSVDDGQMREVRRADFTPRRATVMR